jgi:transcriptional regulator with XRE-family HTH domain
MVTETQLTDALALTWSRTAIRSGLAADLRVAAELSQAEVAAAIGVTPTAVQKWESGRRMPRGQVAVRYARFLVQLADALGKHPVVT